MFIEWGMKFYTFINLNVIKSFSNKIKLGQEIYLCWKSVCLVWVSSPALCKPGMVGHPCYPSTHQEEAGGSEAQRLCSAIAFGANL